MANHPPYDIEVSRIVDAPPEQVFRAFTDAARFATWYGPNGFPVVPASVEIDARVGGRMAFAMASIADPPIRTSFDGRFTDVVENQLLASSGAWDGIPGQDVPWPSHLRVEIGRGEAGTRLVVREGPHPPGTVDLGRQSWEVMLPKLAALLRRQSRHSRAPGASKSA